MIIRRIRNLIGIGLFAIVVALASSQSRADDWSDLLDRLKEPLTFTVIPILEDFSEESLDDLLDPVFPIDLDFDGLLDGEIGIGVDIPLTPNSSIDLDLDNDFHSHTLTFSFLFEFLF
ncbi:MAG: hypothetical protein ACK56W_16605 [Pirellula sp.]|nr:hypothetical protein [Pirellula sp.]